MILQADPTKSSFTIKTPYYVNLFPVAEYAEMISQINAIACLVAFVKIFKYLNLSASFDMLSSVVMRALPDCGFFLILLGVVFFAYSYMANIYFGSYLEPYAKIEHAMVSNPAPPLSLSLSLSLCVCVCSSHPLPLSPHASR